MVLEARTHRFVFLILYPVHVLSVLSCALIDFVDAAGDSDTELFYKVLFTYIY